MGKLAVVNHVSLDGVMQAPGHPDEDRRGGFEHGGWAFAAQDEVMRGRLGAGMAGGGPVLLGRRTYDAFAAFWPNQEANPITDTLNKIDKYVVSNTLVDPLPWANSHVLTGDGATAVARLKNGLTQDITVLGSGRLLQGLIAADLVDEYLLMIHPRVFGQGGKLFEEGSSADLELVECTPTTTGVILATYRPRSAARPGAGGSTNHTNGDQPAGSAN